MAVVLNSENDSKFRKHFMQVLTLIKIKNISLNNILKY